MSLLRRNLLSTVVPGKQTGEFREEHIGSDQQDLSRGIPLEQGKGRCAVRFGQHPFRGQTTVENECVRHRLSLPVRADEGHTIIERR